MSRWDWQALNLPPCGLAESPRFAHGQWAWVDIQARVLYRLQQEALLPNTDLTRVHALPLPDEIGCVLPTAMPEDWVLLGRQGVWHLHQETCRLVQHAPFDSRTHRYNDGRADALGRIWISTLVDARTPASAALYRIQTTQPTLQVPGLIVGNGLAFSPSGNSMFLSDTRHKIIWRFNYNSSTGELGERTVVKQYTEGTARPDGACFSDDGSYWVAVLEGYRLDRFSELGEYIESIPVPLAKPTMPCFGGPGRNTLLVTGASASSEFPNQAGFERISLVACHTRFTGMPEAHAKPFWPHTHLE
ncbi:MAG TPA: SMP-30/gluconolactonase/LRE family protein [Limnobacter sp.]|nr:SMP-30/gluconolactonase/LRE family protein [Limnobacter sp.]